MEGFRYQRTGKVKADKKLLEDRKQNESCGLSRQF